MLLVWCWEFAMVEEFSYTDHPLQCVLQVPVKALRIIAVAFAYMSRRLPKSCDFKYSTAESKVTGCTFSDVLCAQCAHVLVFSDVLCAQKCLRRRI